jgi:hypothetical protein
MDHGGGPEAGQFPPLPRPLLLEACSQACWYITTIEKLIFVSSTSFSEQSRLARIEMQTLTFARFHTQGYSGAGRATGCGGPTTRGPTSSGDSSPRRKRRWSSTSMSSSATGSFVQHSSMCLMQPAGHCLLPPRLTASLVFGGGPRSRRGFPGGRTTRSRTIGTPTSRSSGRLALTPSRTSRYAKLDPRNP